jgi:hypothetical protein
MFALLEGWFASNSAENNQFQLHTYHNRIPAMKNIPPTSFIPRFLFVALSTLVLSATTSHANVYATNIKLNGGTTNISLTASNVSISYILNEPATLGVTIDVKKGTTTARSIVITNGPGTLRGTNVVLWDGKDSSSNSLGSGTYSVSITAAASGFEDWSQISEDSDPGTYVFEPRGIAVNKNPNSPYYGRVFVSNARSGPNDPVINGDRVGMQKLNADASPAAEGSFSTGGWDWAGDFFSPWKMEVGPDDRVYVNDWTSHGYVLSFDQALSTNSQRAVLREDNWPNGGAVNLSGPFISRSGTNDYIWMADWNPGGVGIRRWTLTNGIVATNDLGITVVQAGAGSDLNLFPFDVAVDLSNRIYTIQNRQDSGDPAQRVFRFPAYIESAPAETNADWKIGATDDTMGRAFGVAANPAGTYVAVAFAGVVIGGNSFNGSVRVFDTTNGAPVAKPTPTQNPSHDYRDVAWDNVGNLYVVDNLDSTWRTYSPPGTNQSTTVALATVTVPGSARVAPVLSEPSFTNGLFSFRLTGEANVVYTIEASTNFVSWNAVATNTSVSASRIVTVIAPAPYASYRAFAGSGAVPPAAPILSAAIYAAGQFQFTLTGTANSSYAIQTSPDLQGWTSVITNTSTNAVRIITLPSTAARNFFRAWALP